MSVEIIGIALPQTPEGLYWEDKMRRLSDEAWRNATPMEREIMSQLEAAEESMLLFGVTRATIAPRSLSASDTFYSVKLAH